MVVGSEQYVLWLDVAVDEAILLVNLGYSSQKLEYEPQLLVRTHHGDAVLDLVQQGGVDELAVRDYQSEVPRVDSLRHESEDVGMLASGGLEELVVVLKPLVDVRHGLLISE